MSEKPNPPKPLVAAYYFPNYHVDPRNVEKHGPGWTEWELVKKAVPRFSGHRQPLVPAWGYEDEALPEVMEKKIEAATNHGVGCFLFDWYFYDCGSFLNRCLDEGFLGAGNVDSIQFALMWANHDWYDVHPAKRGAPLSLQWKLDAADGGFERFTDMVIERYFHHPSYLLIDGAPFFSIYHLGILINTFESFSAATKALNGFRERTVRAGFPGLHLNAIGTRGTVLTGEDSSISTYRAAVEMGFDSIGNYCWAHFAQLKGTSCTVDYKTVCDGYFSRFEELSVDSPLPHFPNVSMGWDVSPRVVSSDVWEPHLGYPFTQVISQNTPQAFESALVRAREIAQRQQSGFSMVSINAWNEWTEGSYLEPDTVNGLAYLEAVKRVFTPLRIG